jgi:hypothetical protein
VPRFMLHKRLVKVMASADMIFRQLSHVLFGLYALKMSLVCADSFLILFVR